MGDYAKAAAFYDLLYAGIKDYPAEVRRLRALFDRAAVPVGRVLDVACGSGRHAELLTKAGITVDGLDLEPAFVELAAARCPAGRFWVGDMTAFRVAEPYDAVVCLFGAIGYTLTADRLRAAARCLADAVRPGGIVVLEPWFEPGAMQDGRVTARAAEGDAVAVCRMSRTVIRAEVSRLEFEYLIGRAGGITRLSEVHELGLFTRPTVTAALAAAGLEVSFDSEGLMGRGLYLGFKPSG